MDSVRPIHYVPPPFNIPRSAPAYNLNSTIVSQTEVINFSSAVDACQHKVAATSIASRKVLYITCVSYLTPHTLFMVCLCGNLLCFGPCLVDSLSLVILQHPKLCCDWWYATGLRGDVTFWVLKHRDFECNRDMCMYLEADTFAEFELDCPWL